MQMQCRKRFLGAIAGVLVVSCVCSGSARSFVASYSSPTSSQLRGTLSAEKLAGPELREGAVVSSVLVCSLAFVVGSVAALRTVPISCSPSNRRLVRCHAAPWDMLSDGLSNAFKGSLVDPEYVKTQFFLQDTLKNTLPGSKAVITALQLLPEDHVHMGYVAPKGGPMKFADYIVMGEVEKNLRKTISDASSSGSVPLTFADWKVGAKSGLQDETVDYALLAAGACTKLGSQLVTGLQEVRRLLKYDARVVIIVNEADELALGGTLESLQQQQDMPDLKELEDLEGLGLEEMSSSFVLSASNLRLMKVVRDECGLAIGVFIPKEEPRPMKKSKKTKAAMMKKTAKRPSSARPKARGAGGSR